MDTLIDLMTITELNCYLKSAYNQKDEHLFYAALIKSFSLFEKDSNQFLHYINKFYEDNNNDFISEKLFTSAINLASRHIIDDDIYDEILRKIIFSHRLAGETLEQDYNALDMIYDKIIDYNNCLIHVIETTDYLEENPNELTSHAINSCTVYQKLIVDETARLEQTAKTIEAILAQHASFLESIRQYLIKIKHP